MAKPKRIGPTIVTEVKAFETFYPAEDYHQAYYELNEEAPYCRAVIAPKMAILVRIWKKAGFEPIHSLVIGRKVIPLLIRVARFLCPTK